MPAKCHEFVVSGRTSFPTDMLRYDRCWPRSSQDAATLAATFERLGGVREVREVSMLGLTEPTDGRWESFGWKVA